MSRQHKKNKTRNMNTLVDIVIPVHRRFDLLEKCLASIPDAVGNISYRIIIYDNGSPKEEKEFYRTISPDIKVIQSKDNKGFPYACNVASSYGNSPLIFFLNSDVILHPGSIDYLVRAMDDAKVGIVGMKLIFPDDPGNLDNSTRPAGKVQHVGLAANISANVFHIFIGWRPDHPKVNAIREVQFVTGAAMMVRRSIFNRAGRFFEGYGMGTWEDVDLCVEVRKLGYNILVETKASGIHYTNATALTYGIGYDLRGNRNIFLSRHQQDLKWDEFLFW